MFPILSERCMVGETLETDRIGVFYRPFSGRFCGDTFRASRSYAFLLDFIGHGERARFGLHHSGAFRELDDIRDPVQIIRRLNACLETDDLRSGRPFYMASAAAVFETSLGTLTYASGDCGLFWRASDGSLHRQNNQLPLGILSSCTPSFHHHKDDLYYFLMSDGAFDVLEPRLAELLRLEPHDLLQSVRSELKGVKVDDDVTFILYVPSGPDVEPAA